MEDFPDCFMAIINSNFDPKKLTILIKSVAGQSQYIKIPRRRLDSDRSTSSSLDQVLDKDLMSLLHTIKSHFSNQNLV